MTERMLDGGFLPGLPAGKIRAFLAAAPGNEIDPRRFESPESSACLAANAFGYFLERPADLPPLQAGMGLAWQPTAIRLEAEQRFPWTGGTHPWLDVEVTLAEALVCVESKRYEPFRSQKAPCFADAYWRDVWGRDMAGYCALRDALHRAPIYERLDAAQLVKHAFGIRTRAAKAGKIPVLVYLYAEPPRWPAGAPVPPQDLETHRLEVADFARRVADDEVIFHSLTYRELLETWQQSNDAGVRAHAAQVERAFAPLFPP